MGTWYKVTLPFEEGGVGGKGMSLQDAFSDLFMIARAPKDAVMLSNHEDNFEHCFYYFSPVAVAIAGGLIKQYAGVPCETPKREEISLAVGDASALDILLPEKENN